MLDNVLNSLRRGAVRVQRRGEDVAHSARMRVEIYQLSREQDSLYARLGRAYHNKADAAVLDALSADVRRLDEEISARERLIAELGADQAESEETPPRETSAEAVHAAAARTRPPPALPDGSLASSHEANLNDRPDAGRSEAEPAPRPDAPPVGVPGVSSNAPKFTERPTQAEPRLEPTLPPPASNTASRIWRAKEEQRMSDDTNKVNPVGPISDATMTETGKELPPREREYSGVGDEAERDKMRRHPITLDEGEKAERNPDPLDK